MLPIFKNIMQRQVDIEGKVDDFYNQADQFLT